MHEGDPRLVAIFQFGAGLTHLMQLVLHHLGGGGGGGGRQLHTAYTQYPSPLSDTPEGASADTASLIELAQSHSL